MRIARTLGRMLLGLTALVAAGCGDGPTQIQLNETSIQLTSDPGDVIGGGQTYSYTPANSTIEVDYGPNRLHVLVLTGTTWTGDFRIPGTGTTLQNGSYTGAVLFPSGDATKPALYWTTAFRECTSVTGSFTLQNVRYSGGELRDFDLAFEQHCNGAAPALRGTLHVRR